MTLYELTGGYMEIAAMIDDPDVDPQTIADTLESIGGEIEDKAENYAKIIKNEMADVDALKAEKNRIEGRIKAKENSISWLKQSLQNAMEVTGKTKFKTSLFSFGIQKNPASVEISEGATLPEQYLTPQPPKIDKRGIIAALKDGEIIDGCTLIQSESLRIR